MLGSRGESDQRPLDVALVSTSALPTPPPAYGGTELVVAELARGLLELGHRPTVFAAGDSAGEVCRTIERAVWPPDTLAEVRHSGSAWTAIARGTFDVVHVNSGLALPFTSLVRTPTVATVHHDPDERTGRHYASYPDVAYVAISARQRDLCPWVRFSAVIHHGLAPDDYPAGSGSGGYCAFLGRLAPEKAPHRAIDAARRAGTSVRLAGEVHPGDRSYFERELRPRLGPGVEWLGEIGGAPKLSLLAGASCLLFPVDWEEPFGLVMIEAMLVGTPVIAFPRGSVPEIVEEGVTGFLVRSVDEMAARVASVGSLSRARCRARARERWSAARMAREHVDLYRRVVGARDTRRVTVRERPALRAGPARV